jgi:hypothetical protein
MALVDHANGAVGKPWFAYTAERKARYGANLHSLPHRRK